MLAKFTKASPLPPQPVHSYRTRCSTGDAPRPCIQLKFHYAPRALNSLQKGSRSQDSKGRASPDGEPYPALLVFGQVLRPYRHIACSLVSKRLDSSKDLRLPGKPQVLRLHWEQRTLPTSLRMTDQEFNYQQLSEELYADRA